MAKLIKCFKSASYLTLVLLSLMGSTNAVASVYNTTDNRQAYWFALFPLTISQCVNDICTGMEGYWTKEIWSSLQIDQLVNLTSNNLSSTSTYFGFSLGNTLSGSYRVLLTSDISTGTATLSDELRVAVYDRTDILGISQAGILDFNANLEQDYFVFLSGLLRDNQSYQLQVSSIPLPTGFWLFLSGLVACWVGSCRTREGQIDVR
jgi:hypothetical protein